MKPTTTKIIKQSFLFTGILLLLVSAFTKMLTINFTGLFGDDGFRKELTGYMCPTWYMPLLAAIVLFFLGYFKNTRVFKVLFYFFLPVFLFLICMAVRADLNMYSGYNSNEFHSGYYLALTGTFLIIAAAIISLHRPVVKKSVAETLLDSEV